MHTDAIIQRAQLLLEQGRHDDAQRELGNALHAEPDNVEALTMLAFVFHAKDEYERALELSTRARGLEPGYHIAHYARGLALIGLERPQEALDCASAAMALEPEWPAAFALRARALYMQEKFKEAIEATEEGLRFDPDDGQCQNLRAMSMTRLRRHGDAQGGLAERLAVDPMDPLAHANFGWSLLHQGRSKEAETHFRESLRLDPGNEYARLGVIEAIKGRNPVFRYLLVGLLWFASLNNQVKTGIIIGGFFGYRFMRSWGENNPEYAPLVLFFSVLYLIIVFITWAWEPLTNCTLFLHPFGRQALTPRERYASIAVISSLLLAAAFALAGYLLAFPLGMFLGVVFMLGTIPLAVCFDAAPGKARNFCIAYTAALFTLGLFPLAQFTGIPSFQPGTSLSLGLMLAWVLLCAGWFWFIGHMIPRRTGK